MAHFGFLWTEDIVEHLAEHGVSQDDFEYVIQHPVYKWSSRSSGLPVAWRYSQDGRYIIVVYANRQVDGSAGHRLRSA